MKVLIRFAAVWIGLGGAAHAESGRLPLPPPTPGIGALLNPGTDRIGVPRPGDLDVELARHPPQPILSQPPATNAEPNSAPPLEVIQPGGAPGSGGRIRKAQRKPARQPDRPTQPAPPPSSDLGIADPFAGATGAMGGPEAGPAPAAEAAPTR